MTHEETKTVVRFILASYPNYKPNDIKDLIEAYEIMLSEYDFKVVIAATKTYIATNTSGYAPSIGQIIQNIGTLKDKAQGNEHLSGSEAWSLVYKAVQRGNYYAEEDFKNLPPAVQKAVGSPKMIRSMALDDNFNMAVEQSHFLKAYERALADEKYTQALPEDIKNLLGGKIERINDTTIPSQLV